MNTRRGSDLNRCDGRELNIRGAARLKAVLSLPSEFARTRSSTAMNGAVKRALDVNTPRSGAQKLAAASKDDMCECADGGRLREAKRRSLKLGTTNPQLCRGLFVRGPIVLSL